MKRGWIIALVALVVLVAAGVFFTRRSFWIARVKERVRREGEVELAKAENLPPAAWDMFTLSDLINLSKGRPVWKTWSESRRARFMVYLETSVKPVTK